MEKRDTMGSRLKALRVQRDEKQEEVAVAVGISRPHLAKIETGGDNPGRAILAALAKYYGVSMDYLETGAPPAGSERPNNSFSSEDELAWVRVGRELDGGQRIAVLEFIKNFLANSRPERPGRKPHRRRG